MLLHNHEYQQRYPTPAWWSPTATTTLSLKGACNVFRQLFIWRLVEPWKSEQRGKTMSWHTQSPWEYWRISPHDWECGWNKWCQWCLGKSAPGSSVQQHWQKHHHTWQQTRSDERDENFHRDVTDYFWSKHLAQMSRAMEYDWNWCSLQKSDCYLFVGWRVWTKLAGLLPRIPLSVNLSASHNRPDHVFDPLVCSSDIFLSFLIRNPSIMIIFLVFSSPSTPSYFGEMVRR